MACAAIESPMGCGPMYRLYPIKHKYTWAPFDNICKYYLEALNYPKLPPTKRFCSEKYFISTLKHATKMNKGVPKLECCMLVKIVYIVLIFLQD